jgi:hypothetical protein
MVDKQFMQPWLTKKPEIKQVFNFWGFLLETSFQMAWQFIAFTAAIVFIFIVAFGATTPENFTKLFLPFFSGLVGFIFIASTFYQMLSEINQLAYKKFLFGLYFSMLFLIVSYIIAFIYINLFKNDTLIFQILFFIPIGISVILFSNSFLGILQILLKDAFN